MTQPVIETEIDEDWDMEDTPVEAGKSKTDEKVHVIVLSEEKADGVYIDKLTQVVAKQLHSKDLSSKSTKACQKKRLNAHALETIDNLSWMPEAVVYQLGSRTVRVSLKDSYRPISKKKFEEIKAYAPEFAKEAFVQTPVIKVDSPKVPATARKEIQEWIEMGRAILREHKVESPESVITFESLFKPKSTTNDLKSRQNVVIQESLNTDLPYGTVLTIGKVD